MTADDWAKAQQDYKPNTDAAAIRLPISGSKRGQWSWLQPYPGEQPSNGRRYNELDVGEDGT